MIDGDIGHIAGRLLQQATGHAPRSPAVRAGVAEQADDGQAQAGGQVHRAAIGADQGLAFGERRDQFGQGLCRPGNRRCPAADLRHDFSRLGIVTRMQRVVFGTG